MTIHSPISKATSPLSLRERARARAKTKRQIEVTMFACGAKEIRELDASRGKLAEQ
jgi:isopentenyl diphosphate isomerase/L-lactate dehydrogenase-like FMN-dependent dehydrogenase